MINKNLRFAITSSLFLSVITAASAGEKPAKKPQPPKMINGIPVNWDYYALEKATIEKYSGDAHTELCLDDDLKSAPNRFGTIEPYGVDLNRTASQRGGRIIQGAKDFVVLGKKHVLINTPKTGQTLVEVRFCKKSLRRAKLLIVPNERDGVCLRERKSMIIFTRLNGTYDVCKIGAIQTWNGSNNITALKQQSEMLYASDMSDNQ